MGLAMPVPELLVSGADKFVGFANSSFRETVPRVRMDKTSVLKHFEASFYELLSFSAVFTLHGLVYVS
jgi:hypothetical protein